MEVSGDRVCSVVSPALMTDRMTSECEWLEPLQVVSGSKDGIMIGPTTMIVNPGASTITADVTFDHDGVHGVLEAEPPFLAVHTNARVGDQDVAALIPPELQSWIASASTYWEGTLNAHIEKETDRPRVVGTQHSPWVLTSALSERISALFGQQPNDVLAGAWFDYNAKKNRNQGDVWARVENIADVLHLSQTTADERGRPVHEISLFQSPEFAQLVRWVGQRITERISTFVDHCQTLTSRPVRDEQAKVAQLCARILPSMTKLLGTPPEGADSPPVAAESPWQWFQAMMSDQISTPIQFGDVSFSARIGGNVEVSNTHIILHTVAPAEIETLDAADREFLDRRFEIELNIDRLALPPIVNTISPTLHKWVRNSRLAVHVLGYFRGRADLTHSTWTINDGLTTNARQSGFIMCMGLVYFGTLDDPMLLDFGNRMPFRLIVATEPSFFFSVNYRKVFRVVNEIMLTKFISQRQPHQLLERERQLKSNTLLWTPTGSYRGDVEKFDVHVKITKTQPGPNYKAETAIEAKFTALEIDRGILEDAQLGPDVKQALQVEYQQQLAATAAADVVGVLPLLGIKDFADCFPPDGNHILDFSVTTVQNVKLEGDKWTSTSEGTPSITSKLGSCWKAGTAVQVGQLFLKGQIKASVVNFTKIAHSFAPPAATNWELTLGSRVARQVDKAPICEKASDPKHHDLAVLIPTFCAEMDDKYPALLAKYADEGDQFDSDQDRLLFQLQMIDYDRKKTFHPLRELGSKAVIKNIAMELVGLYALEPEISVAQAVEFLPRGVGHSRATATLNASLTHSTHARVFWDSQTEGPFLQSILGALNNKLAPDESPAPRGSCDPKTLLGLAMQGDLTVNAVRACEQLIRDGLSTLGAGLDKDPILGRFKFSERFAQIDFSTDQFSRCWDGLRTKDTSVVAGPCWESVLKPMLLAVHPFSPEGVDACWTAISQHFEDGTRVATNCQTFSEQFLTRVEQSAAAEGNTKLADFARLLLESLSGIWKGIEDQRITTRWGMLDEMITNSNRAGEESISSAVRRFFSPDNQPGQEFANSKELLAFVFDPDNWRGQTSCFQDPICASITTAFHSEPIQTAEDLDSVEWRSVFPGPAESVSNVCSFMSANEWPTILTQLCGVVAQQFSSVAAHVPRAPPSLPPVHINVSARDSWNEVPFAKLAETVVQTSAAGHFLKTGALSAMRFEADIDFARLEKSQQELCDPAPDVAPPPSASKRRTAEDEGYVSSE